jgi:hypothetical protein
MGWEEKGLIDLPIRIQNRTIGDGWSPQNSARFTAAYHGRQRAGSMLTIEPLRGAKYTRYTWPGTTASRADLSTSKERPGHPVPEHWLRPAASAQRAAAANWAFHDCAVTRSDVLDALVEPPPRKSCHEAGDGGEEDEDGGCVDDP